MARFSVEGSSSIVTGGSSGIGEACARLLAAAGSKVVIADINEERGQALASELDGVFVRCDVTKTEDADAAVAAAVACAPLRACVNSAGLGAPGRTIDRSNTPLDLDKFSFVISVNLIGTFNVARLAAAQMVKQDPVTDDGGRGLTDDGRRVSRVAQRIADVVATGTDDIKSVRARRAARAGQVCPALLTGRRARRHVTGA